jgi:hypothetical protein
VNIVVNEKDSIKEWFKKLTPEVIQEGNRIEQEISEKDYTAFKTAFETGICHICGLPFKTISTERPCVHWLIRECKFRKKDFSLIYEKFDYFRINAFLRWVANKEKFMRNINNLKEEKDPSKLIETTIKYKHIDWSFSCSLEDYKGHIGKQSNFPHYHFQMRINGQQFINFSDYHIPFTEEDLFKLTLIHELGAIESYGTGGAGLDEGFNIDPEYIVKHTKVSENEVDGIYHFSTMAKFRDGISGDKIYQLFEESKKTGRTITQLLIEHGGDVTSIISPHDSLLEISKRSGRSKL